MGYYVAFLSLCHLLILFRWCVQRLSHCLIVLLTHTTQAKKMLGKTSTTSEAQMFRKTHDEKRFLSWCVRHVFRWRIKRGKMNRMCCVMMMRARAAKRCLIIISGCKKRSETIDKRSRKKKRTR